MKDDYNHATNWLLYELYAWPSSMLYSYFLYEYM